MHIPATLQPVLDAIIAAGGRPYLVGGFVRDSFLGIASKDIDCEVFGLSIEQLETSLSSFKCDVVGRSFGVIKVTTEGETYDITLPRRESKTGQGHRGFLVEADPTMTFEEAASRRDLTINSIGYDPITCEVIDPFGGIQDIQNKVILHTSEEHFAEDPLRVLRACQFAARFDFTIAPETTVLCYRLKDELKTLPKERVWTEFQKLLLKSPKPSIGLEALRSTGALSLFPELEALIDIQQDDQWHPEGCVWTHTLMVVDEAVRVLADDNVTDEYERLVVLLGALCHDLGKPAVTEFKEGSDGVARWRAHDHESQGVKPTEDFLGSMGVSPDLIKDVTPLVAHHLKPFQFFREKASNSAIRRLAVKAPLIRLTRVARADFLGRTTPEALACEDSRTIEDIVWLLDKAETLQVKDEGPKPILMGRHLLDLGMQPGKAMGVLLKQAMEAQLDGVFDTEAEAIAWAARQLDTE
jgi:tRNA nucleotidyltransferase (CCA-adding enzyme)